MTLHRFILLASAPLVLIGSVVVAACSSSSTAPSGNNGLPPGCPADPFATNGLDQNKMSRDDFCARYVKAITDKAAAVPCTLAQPPTCPKVMDDFEKASVPPGTCVIGYSQGTIANCECRIASYTTCGDFSAKPCEFGVLYDPSGAACADAGTDGGADSSSDALPDTSAFDDADAGGGG